MNAHLAELSRTIDRAELGRRLKAARVAAGLTQAELAGSDVTAAYVSRIEVGQRRPEALLLERMATRAGTTVHELLTGVAAHESRSVELEVDRAAIELALGSPATALRQIEQTLARVLPLGDPALEASARRVRADARRAIGDLATAIAELEDLVEQPGRDLNRLRSLISLCDCYCDLGEPWRAVALGRIAAVLAAELSADAVAEGLRLDLTLARAFGMQGDLENAEATSARALHHTQTDPDPVAMAKAYWKASIAESDAHGATPAALELAQVALALTDLAENGLRLGSILPETDQASRRHL